MANVSDSASASETAARHRFLKRGVKVAIAIAAAVTLAAGAGGAYAYTDHVTKQSALDEQVAAAQLAQAHTRLSLAEASALHLEAALTAIAAAATDVADAKTVTTLTAAVVVLKDETDKPAFPKLAPVTAVNDRAVDLDAAVTAALATVHTVGASVQTVSTTRLAAAISASAASASAAKAALAALNLSVNRHDDPRGLIIPTITTVKAAQASSDAAVAAAVAAAAAAAAAAAQAAAARAAQHYSGGGGGGGGTSYAAGPGAPVCASDVLSCVNQIRSYYGLRSLSSNGTLNAGAQACADRMAASGSMTHSPYPGGWGVWGENIAEGYGSQVSVFNAWMASPGHRANILRPSFTQMGIGHVAAGSWWCQQFGG
jgi:uncharacterized protein YkwD